MFLLLMSLWMFFILNLFIAFLHHLDAIHLRCPMFHASMHTPSVTIHIWTIWPFHPVALLHALRSVESWFFFFFFLVAVERRFGYHNSFICWGRNVFLFLHLFLFLFLFLSFPLSTTYLTHRFMGPSISHRLEVAIFFFCYVFMVHYLRKISFLLPFF